MKPSIRIQLSVMMFLEFFIWGSWFVTMGTYLSKSLKATDVQNGYAYSTQSLGAIIAPFVIGLIADRFFSAQKILGVLHLLGAALMYLISSQPHFDTFYPFLLGYMIVYMPTLALVNAVAFRQLSNPEKEFSTLRVWGTFGWIVAGLLIGWIAWERTDSLVNTFRLASGVSALLGIYSFFLPETPPGAKGKKVTVAGILGTDSLKLLKDKDFLIFFISSILICIPLAFYYQEANVFLNEIDLTNAAAKMTMGQMSEFIFMLLIPLFFRRFGVKKMLLIGMLAWVIRYVCFAYGNSSGATLSFIYLGIILHGVCYDFFFVIGQIYTDKRAGQEIRAAAQGMITLATYGAGMLIGFWIAGFVTEHFKTSAGHNWNQVWLIPAGIAALVLIFFLIFFNDRSDSSFRAESVEMV